MNSVRTWLLLNSGSRAVFPTFVIYFHIPPLSDTPSTAMPKPCFIPPPSKSSLNSRSTSWTRHFAFPCGWWLSAGRGPSATEPGSKQWGGAELGDVPSRRSAGHVTALASLRLQNLACSTTWRGAEPTAFSILPVTTPSSPLECPHVPLLLTQTHRR